MSAKEEVVLQAVPNSIKYGAVGLLVLLICTILWFTSSSDDEENQMQAPPLGRTREVLASKVGAHMQHSVIHQITWC